MFHSILRRDPARSILCGLLLLAGAVLFVNLAGINGRKVNTRIESTDQKAYISHAVRFQETDFQYVAPRNRMPLYPAFLASLLGDLRDRQAIFAQAKIWNTWLSLGCLVVIGAVFFRFLPRVAAINATFLAAFTFLVFKAPYVQAEVAYYTLTLLLFATAWRIFTRPQWIWFLLAGGLAGLTHLTKASVLPGFFCFVFFFGLDSLWRWRTGQGNLRTTLHRTGLLLVAVTSFVLVILPYIRTSKAIYGQYFYNVNSSLYLWADSWKQANAGVRSANDGHGWPDLSPEKMPSAAKYWREHTLVDIGHRMWKGFGKVWSSICGGYGYRWFFQGLSLAAVALAWHRRRLLWRLFRRQPVPVLALAAYFGGYYLVVAWYTPITVGNRFILTLYLPFLLTIYQFLTVFGKGLTCSWRGRIVPLLTVFHGVTAIGIIAQMLVVSVKTIHTAYGGS